MTASGSDRYLVLELVPSDGGSPRMTDGFRSEASQSLVTYGSGRQAGLKNVALDADFGVIQVVHGFVPPSVGDGDVLLNWPGNEPLLLTIY